MSTAATKNTDERYRCPACGSAELTEPAGRTHYEKAIWLLKRAKDEMPDENREAVLAIEEAIRGVDECGE